MPETGEKPGSEAIEWGVVASASGCSWMRLSWGARTGDSCFIGVVFSGSTRVGWVDSMSAESLYEDGVKGAGVPEDSRSKAGEAELAAPWEDSAATGAGKSAWTPNLD